MRRFLIFVFLGLIGTAWCLDPNKPISQYVHTVWHSENGLPQNSIQALLQTQDDYLWIGTQEGVVRFNGREFKVYSSPRLGILHKDVRVLYQTHNGVLWIGTFGGGVARYSDHDQAFIPYNTHNGLSNNSITSILEDHQGNLWVGTNDGLNRWTGDRFISLDRKNGLSDAVIRALGEDADGRLLVATRSGLNVLQDGRVTGAFPLPIPGKNVITSLLLDRQKNLWIGTDNRGISVVQSGKLSHYGLAEGLPNAPVHTIFEDKQGTIWAGMQGGGMCRLSRTKFDCYSVQNGLSGDYVEAIIQDHEGNLWVGTETGGLNRFKEGPLTNYGNELGFKGSPKALLEDSDGSLWIGTSTGLWRLKNGKAIPYLTGKGPANNYAYSLFKDRQGNVWVGTDEGGLNEFTGHSVKTYRKADGLADDWVPAVYQDRAGDIWAGTFAGGVSRLHNGKFTNYTTKEGLGNNRVWAIHEDYLGNLWFGTDAGLSLFRNGGFTNFDLQNSTEQTLGMGGVMVIYEDSDHVFWIGTYGGGLKRFKDGKFSTVRSDDGLSDDTIWSILEDGRGNFWMSSNRGIFKVNKKELIEVMERRQTTIHSESFDVADGMMSSECNGGSQHSGWKTRQGKLLFACLKSVVEVDPENLAFNQQPPPVVIENVKINEERTAPGARTKSGSGEAEFHFSALTYFAPEKVVYLCKLEPYDADWKTPVTPGIASYTNLPPGNYTFRVKAANNGVWSKEETTFHFYLIPRFYQTTWFASLCGLMLLLLSAVMYLLRIRQVRRRERKLVVLVGRRTRELQAAKEVAEAATRAKSDFLANMSHEIRTPLNGVTGMLDLVCHSELTTDQKQLLSMARDSANTLMVVINDILDFSKIEAGKLAFDVREFALPETVAEAARTMALRAHQKGLELVYQVDPAIPQYLLGDNDRIKQVLHNLVGNAVKFTQRGEVALRVSMEQRNGNEIDLRFAVSDTGIGISSEKQQIIFEPFSQADASTTRRFGGTGLGLAISQRIVELMGGWMGVDSKVGEGSTFYFTARMQVSQRATARKSEPPRELRGASVLIVDDNESSRAVLEQTLEAPGMRVSTVDSAAKALRLLQAADGPDAAYQVLIVDSRMPAMDGFELVSRLADPRLRAAVVMMLTSDDYNAAAQRCRELGVNTCLIKPVKQCELLAAVRRILAPHEAANTLSQEQKPQLARLRVLLAEDNLVNQRLAVRLLERMGHEVVVAQTGKEVLEILQTGTFDLVLMDVQMPEMDGLAATREIRQWEQGRRTRVPIIAMTAHAMKGDRENCMQVGMDGYVAKPIDRFELQQVIEEVIRANATSSAGAD